MSGIYWDSQKFKKLYTLMHMTGILSDDELEELTELTEPDNGSPKQMVKKLYEVIDRKEMTRVKDNG